MTTIASAPQPRPVVPFWFLRAARAVPAGILAQYLLAGLALFQDGLFWAWHGGLGLAIFLPIAAMALAAWLARPARALRWWTGLLVVLYVLQVVLIVSGQSFGSGLLQALHPFNGGLMLVASLVLVAKVERNRARTAR
ncbi:hypothetical protein GB927_005110 [Shinella sp. CPCC 100929]|uniref:Uncharacterized protein n=1 Tax=Shinella lacus TaxID=2654216 RepID=A0ABT1R2J3_9HYPH|nr:DUF6220 domain-containing protein [Shinella lacus]MCQ4629405.1 hypothetical protein [Shinella lacus]